MSNPGIEARALRKDFGTFRAVRDIDLSVPAGTIFGFLGPNGSGKSTTVRMLTGLLRPTAGEAYVAGLPVSVGAPELKRQIGVVPEDLGLFDRITLWEHLMLAGPVYGLSRVETESRARDLLGVLDLWETRHTYADQGSFGMRKKCSLAMALLHNPRVLFLDEPFEGIDPVSAGNIRLLLTAVSERGVTVFLTSHILEIAQELIHGFAIIAGGGIRCRATMAELAASSRSLRDVYFEHVGHQAAAPLPWLG
jgi:ABC-2 type transport system ATP-binding protein